MTNSKQPQVIDRTISALAANLIGVVLTFLLFGFMLGAYSALWHENPLAIYAGTDSPFSVMVVSLLVFFVSIFIHEGLHGIGFWWGGAKRKQIEFGFQWKSLTPYAHCTIPLRVDAYRLAGALPGIVLGIIPAAVGLFRQVDWLMLYGTAMMAGAIGDFIIFLLLVPLKGDTLVLDHATKPGFQILSSPQDGQ